MLDVFVTVDTECSMGGAWNSPMLEPVGPERAVLGKSGIQRDGAPLIMDILEAYGLRATFFVEAFARGVVDEAALALAYREIVERGHDVQLHLHPVFYHYAQVRQGLRTRQQVPEQADWIGGRPMEAQLALLRDGVASFEGLVGRKPVAFRAGNYAADDTTLEALGELGIRYDSSFNAAYEGRVCRVTRRGGGPNSPWQAGSVWEVPLTVFSTGVGRLAGLKPLEISAVSLWEIRGVLEQAEALGMSCVTMILHSFSLFKKSDSQFSGIRRDRLVIRRLHGLCRFLVEQRGRFRVTTFSDLPEPRSDLGLEKIPRMGVVIPAVRRVLQGVNRLYWV